MAWLVVSTAFIGLAILGIFALMGSDEVERPGVLLLPAFLLVLMAISIWGIWTWQKWGVYGVAATSILSPFVEAMIGVATPSDFFAPFIQLAVLAFLVKDRWHYFE